MAEKYDGSFVSKTVIDKKKEAKRSYLEAELERARVEFEAKKRLKNLKEQRGDTKWILPSLNERISKDHEEDSIDKKKKRRKNDKKSKKHKKEKKHKKVKLKKKKKAAIQSSSSSDDSSEDEWVEKDMKPTIAPDSTSTQDERTDPPTEQPLLTDVTSDLLKREDWMLSTTLLDHVAGSSKSKAESREKRKEENLVEKPSIDKPGQHPKELNPFWKDGGTGLPSNLSEDSRETRCAVGDSGRSWIQKAYERAKEQAEDQGRRLEDVIAERWGSMEKFNALLKASDRRNRSDRDKDRRSGWRKQTERQAESQNDRQMGTQGWRKTQRSPCNDHRARSDQHALENTMSNSLENERTGSGLSNKRESTHTHVVKDRCNPIKRVANVLEEPIQAASPTSRDRSSSEAESSDDSVEEGSQQQTEVYQPLSEKEINEISAKILRAELMGNEDLVAELKTRLEKGRTMSVPSKKDSDERIPEKRNIDDDEEVILTRTDKHGNLYPLNVSGEGTETRRKRRKLKKIETHDSHGNRLRYHQEDDRTDLKSMIEEERLTNAEDHQRGILARLSGKLGSTMGDYYTLDDMFETSSANKQSSGMKDEKAKKRAISEHQRAMSQQSKCKFCFENPDIAKHLIISIGSHVYMALPITASLTEGHCMIIPMQHSLASTYLDEDVMHEVMMFKTSLVKMFNEKEEDVIFLETFSNIKHQRHMFIECIPVPKEVGDMAPIYFKKALQECEDEWASNKKVVEIVKTKGIKKAIPKGLPFFAVEFGLDGGFGHVIENQESFQHYFGKEVIGNVLDLEPVKWRRPPKQNFQLQKRKVIDFAETWTAFDWTRDL